MPLFERRKREGISRSLRPTWQRAHTDFYLVDPHTPVWPFNYSPEVLSHVFEADSLI